jgi:hypothetical protein
MIALLQSVILFAAAGSVLLMAIVLRRWTASIEARLTRIDSLIDRVGSGTFRKRVS